MTQKAHVLALPSPALGHINPMVQFSKILISRGVKVTLVTIECISKSMLTDSTIEIESIPHELPSFGGADKFLEMFQDSITNNLGGIVKKFADSECPVNVLLFDSLTSWVIELAHELELKVAAFFTQPCALSAIFYHMDKIPYCDGSSVSLPSLPLLDKEDLPSFVYNGDLYPSVTRLVFNQNINFKKADFLLFNTFDVLEKEVVNWFRTKYPILTIGPTVLPMDIDKRLKDDKEHDLRATPSGKTCMKWLDLREISSVVYVAFGSQTSLGDRQMEELAWGLMMSNCYFLWVVKTSEENRVPVEFMSKTSEKGLIVDWSPQLDVLAHQAIGCFLTHCGWNSTIEALSLGVPMVAMPEWADQPTNAKFISDVWRAGIRVKCGNDGIVNREEIASSISQVMKEEKGVMLKENAIKWKQLAKQAVDDGGSSCKNIDEFLSNL